MKIKMVSAFIILLTCSGLMYAPSKRHRHFPEVNDKTDLSCFKRKPSHVLSDVHQLVISNVPGYEVIIALMFGRGSKSRLRHSRGH